MEQKLKAGLTEQRISEWTGAIEQELQELVQQAASIRQNIVGAKTTVKKQYFEKKFKKVQQDVMSMLATLQRLKEMSPKQEQQENGDNHVTADQPITT